MKFLLLPEAICYCLRRYMRDGKSVSAFSDSEHVTYRRFGEKKARRPPAAGAAAVRRRAPPAFCVSVLTEGVGRLIKHLFALRGIHRVYVQFWSIKCKSTVRPPSESAHTPRAPRPATPVATRLSLQVKFKIPTFRIGNDSGPQSTGAAQSKHGRGSSGHRISGGGGTDWGRSPVRLTSGKNRGRITCAACPRRPPALTPRAPPPARPPSLRRDRYIAFAFGAILQCTGYVCLHIRFKILYDFYRCVIG
ncbi:hypothetical protein EVAR_85457_1 [Eumeta japonica]|uniref:Uncharacterized protein n=1 Tax=Eumeta variegata TaxID=151549 RepID=A0A4C1WMA3_EUMVA|nr:hypothetical protein EVAR_85457_1 [Eumeta japonica]